MNVREIAERLEINGSPAEIMIADTLRQLQQQIDDMKKPNNPPEPSGPYANDPPIVRTLFTLRDEAVKGANFEQASRLRSAAMIILHGEKPAPPPPLPGEQKVKHAFGNTILQQPFPLCQDRGPVEFALNHAEITCHECRRILAESSHFVTGMTTEPLPNSKKVPGGHKWVEQEPDFGPPICSQCKTRLDPENHNDVCPESAAEPLPTIEPPEAIADRLIKQINSSRRFEFVGSSKTIVLYAGELATQSSLQIILDGLRENLSAAISLHRGQIESAARAKGIEECINFIIQHGFPNTAEEMRRVLIPHPPQEARTT